MAENMVRTQVYLPQAVYTQLQIRAKKHGLTLAVQIRAALDDYLLGAEAGKKPSPFDPGELFAIIDSLEGGGPGDLAENHDKYIYGDPHGEKAFERERLRANLKAESA